MSKVKHGMVGTKLYNSWRGMRNRCEKPTHNRYKYYGGKGIIVCVDWLKFVGFRDWAMDSGYVEGLSIDRIDNDKNYTPDNCEWITLSDNSGKGKAGEGNGRSKLLPNDVLEIRRLYAAGGTTYLRIAGAFGVSISHVSSIINNRYWRHI